MVRGWQFPLALLLLGACAAPVPAPYARLLGAAQDGGIPHVTCPCANCAQAASRPSWAHRVAALAVVGRDGRWWLIDATPDFPEQVADMGSLPSGILLTHAHIGHYTGLMYLGREALGSRSLPVYCSARMTEFLRQNGPWSQLVALGQIELHTVRSGEKLALDEELSITPLRVPHRDELSDTCAFLVEVRGGRRLLYLPDIDAWERWEHDLRSLAVTLDYLLVDGTFYSSGELPGRALAEIPHPFVTHTVELLEPVVNGTNAAVVFLHLNHSNPLWNPDTAAARALRERGFWAAPQLRCFPLAPSPAQGRSAPATAR